MSIGSPSRTCKHAFAIGEPGAPPARVLCTLNPPRIFAQWFLLTGEDGKSRPQLAQGSLYPEVEPNFGCQHHALALATADATATAANSKRLIS